MPKKTFAKLTKCTSGIIQHLLKTEKKVKIWRIPFFGKQKTVSTETVKHIILCFLRRFQKSDHNRVSEGLAIGFSVLRVEEGGRNAEADR